MKIKTTIRGGAVNAAALGAVRLPPYGGRGCGGGGGYPIQIRTAVA